MGEVELMDIDWQKKSFTVYFSSFWNEYQSNYSSITSCSKSSRKTSKTLINWSYFLIVNAYISTLYAFTHFYSKFAQIFQGSAL